MKLDEPLLHLDIYEKNTTSEIAQMEIIPMDFVLNQTSSSNNMFISTFENFIYQVELRDNGLELQNFYRVHEAPVSCISYMNMRKFAERLREEHSESPFNINPLVTSNYIITGSFDWTIKVFHESDLTESLVQLIFHKDFISSLHVNPQNPFLVASADSDGVLAVWNLQKKSSAPVFHWKASFCISRIRWNLTGNKLAVCDCKGNIQIISVRKGIVNLKDESLNAAVQNEFEISRI